MSAEEIVWDSFMIDSFERNALFRIPSVCLQALCRKSYCVLPIVLHIIMRLNGKEKFSQIWKVEQLSVPRGMSVRTVLVYDGHLAPKVQADGSFDFAIPVEELFK